MAKDKKNKKKKAAKADPEVTHPFGEGKPIRIVPLGMGQSGDIEVGEGMMMGPLPPDIKPEDVPEFIVKQVMSALTSGIKSAMGGGPNLHEKIAEFGGWMAGMSPDPDSNPKHGDKSLDEITADHDALIELVDTLDKTVDKEHPEEWSDGTKLRTMALTLYGFQVDDEENGCIHHDTIQQDLLAMADRLDMLDHAEAGVRGFDFDHDYQAGLAGEGEEE